MKLYLCSFALVVLGILFVPANSQAYSVTNTTATDLGNGYALFTVTYKFGFLNRDLYMPIQANRNTKYSDTSSNVGFSILLDGKTEAKATTSPIQTNNANVSLNYSILPGKAKGIVLSEAEIKDNQYYVPQGKSDTFTLIALVDMRSSTVKNDISLQMTSLPFTMVDGKKMTAARLNVQELESYKTNEITLK